MSLTIDTGPVHYTLQVPALDLPQYRLLQGVIWRRLIATRAKGRLLRFGLALVVGGLIGGIGGLIAAWGNLDALLWVGYGRESDEITLDGFGVFALGLGLILLVMMLTTLLHRARQLSHIALLHRLGGAMLDAHELLVAEAGLVLRNAGRTMFLPWSHMTGMAQGRGMLFLVVDRTSALWLPDSLLAALPDREGLMAFLRARIPG